MSVLLVLICNMFCVAGLAVHLSVPPVAGEWVGDVADGEGVGGGGRSEGALFD